MDSLADYPFDAWPVGIIEAAPDGRIRTINAAASRMTARLGTAGGAGGTASLATWLRTSAAALAAGESLRDVLRGAADTRVAVHVTRGVAGFTVLLVDESLLLHAEQAAQRHEARFHALSESVAAGAVFTLDATGLVNGWSRAAEESERLSAAEATGLPFDLLLARTHLGLDAAALLAEAAASGSARVQVDRLTTDTDLRRVDIDIRAVHDADGTLDGFVVCLKQPDTAQRREAELRRLAETDPLTGVLNRRAFDETAATACALARAQGEPFAVVALDLDGFKSLNDRYGHAAGDAALRAMADTARRDLRAGDLIGRLGGDEFAIALPGADTDLAQRIAERLRQSFTRLRVRHGREHLRFSASFGVAASNRTAESFAQTLGRADAALYRAKHDGRDRVAAA
jgi:diguanylate cyclase (GGDEF)-like protein